LIVVNPPWTLEKELQLILPALGQALSRGRPGRTVLQWLGAAGR
jgi:23S rRNA A2030 N6-methylase RlmJ